MHDHSGSVFSKGEVSPSLPTFSLRKRPRLLRSYGRPLPLPAGTPRNAPIAAQEPKMKNPRDTRHGCRVVPLQNGRAFLQSKNAVVSGLSQKSVTFSFIGGAHKSCAGNFALRARCKLRGDVLQGTARMPCRTFAKQLRIFAKQKCGSERYTDVPRTTTARNHP